MKKLLYISLLLFTATLSFTACSDDSTDVIDPVDSLAQYKTKGQTLRRTVIAFVCGDNNLSSGLQDDIKEMITGSKSLAEDCRLILIADLSNKTPYISEIRKGKETKVLEYKDNFYLLSPDTIHNMMQWVINNYPSSEYAAVLEGHGLGSIEARDTVKTDFISLKAYGYDKEGTDAATSTNKWLNGPTMAKTLASLKNPDGIPLKFQYIFFDCCAMQTAEMGYELRDVTDYIISPVSETPKAGADYTAVVPKLSVAKEFIGTEIVNTYGSKNLCLSAVRTAGMEALLQQTRTALEEIAGKLPDTKKKLAVGKCIYYLRTNAAPALHDMRSVMFQMVKQGNLSQSTYDTWLAALDGVVVAKQMATTWTTDSSININFYAFTVDEDNYGGISMIIPQEGPGYEYSNNLITLPILQAMYSYQWCNKVGWKNLGW